MDPDVTVTPSAELASLSFLSIVIHALFLTAYLPAIWWHSDTPTW
jgi:hypothetical protein